MFLKEHGIHFCTYLIGPSIRRTLAPLTVARISSSGEAGKKRHVAVNGPTSQFHASLCPVSYALVYTAALNRRARLRMARHSFWELRWVFIFFFAAASLLMDGQAKPASGSHAQNRLVQARDKVLQDGLQATLPPHLATLLGMTKEQECAVMQGISRTGKVVQGFDVSVENNRDIVLFVVEESSNDQTLYLTSPQGRLRKMVSVKSGVGQVAKITDADTKAFEKEKEFWLGRLAPVRATK
jgi:hypothetical protein